MLYLVALFIPGLAMILAGRVLSGVACAVLQLTLIGWIPATLWAFFVVMEHNNGKRMDQMVAQLRR